MRYAFSSALTMDLSCDRAMLRDPIEYPEPETFKPERFLDERGEINHSVRKPDTAAFGFGRRWVPSVPCVFIEDKRDS